MKELGVYVHIPFCIQKCYYCDFISYANKTELIEKYVECLIKDIKQFDFTNYTISSIYIGGGTPSFIDNKYIELIMKELLTYVKNEIEITIEANPGSLNSEKLKGYLSAGINRLSMGLQSTNNNLLKEIGRIHSFEQFLDNYKEAQNIGFKNINIDLMFGLPNQTKSILDDSLNKIIKLNPKHISTYSLIIEENTIMETLINEKKLVLPNDELEREMYWYIKNKLEQEGYKHYEISNFAKEGFESKHNTDCWNQKEYVGFGVAAHSYINYKRYSNTENIEQYINNIESSEYEKNKMVHEILDKSMQEKEYMLLGLRKIDGIKINEFKEKFNEKPNDLFKNQLKKLENNKLIVKDENSIKLTNKGLDLANLVWEEFI